MAARAGWQCACGQTEPLALRPYVLTRPFWVHAYMMCQLTTLRCLLCCDPDPLCQLCCTQHAR